MKCLKKITHTANYEYLNQASPFPFTQISCMDFKTSQYLTVHNKAIRDCCFHPFVDDGILLSCGLDKTAKMTSVISNTVVQT